MKEMGVWACGAVIGVVGCAVAFWWYFKDVYK